MVATTVADVSAKALTPLPESIPAEMRALGEREVLEGPVLSLRGVSAEVSTPPKEVVSLTTLQQNVFLVTKISEEIFFVTKNTALVTKYEFRH